MHSERSLTSSPFPTDEGRARDATRQALAAAARPSDPRDYLRAVAALCADRVLVPVVAQLREQGSGARGLIADKKAEMSVVGMQAADGRRAMLAFTGLDSLHDWDAQARPVPVTLDVAAQSALADGATAVLVDVAGPHPLAIDGEVLAELALGHRLVEVTDGEFGWAMAEDDASTRG